MRVAGIEIDDQLVPVAGPTIADVATMTRAQLVEALRAAGDTEPGIMADFLVEAYAAAENTDPDIII